MDVFQLILKELWSSISWGFLGFLITLFILALLNKKKWIGTSSNLQKIKLIAYYLFFPLAIAFASWFYKAVSAAHHQVELSVKYTVESVEDIVYKEFHTYITSTIEAYGDQLVIPTNDEIVFSFLKEDSTSGWIKRKALHWSLVELLEYLEKEAMEQTGVKVENHHLTIAVLKDDKNFIHVPFKKIEKQVNKPVAAFFNTYYIVSYIIFGVVFVILLIDIIITLKRKKKNNTLTTT